jgi:DUF1009 family protein
MERESVGSVAIIAGGGTVPLHVARSAIAAGRRVMIIALDGEADRAGVAEFPHEWLRWGEFGRLEALLRERQVKDVVFVGNVRGRPDLSRIKLDFGAVRILPDMVGLFARGDSELLDGIVRIFDRRGFRVVGSHEIAPDLLIRQGLVGKVGPHKTAVRDIALAMRAARAIGGLDAGQAAVSINGRVVALEAAEGTDAMLQRVAALREGGRLRWKGRSGVLAKCPKPQQDLRVDMPTIGPQTIDTVAAIGLAGIAAEADRVMLIDRAAAVARMDAEGLFVTGEHAPSDEFP